MLVRRRREKKNSYDVCCCCYCSWRFGIHFYEPVVYYIFRRVVWWWVPVNRMLILRENNCFVEYIKYYVEPFQVFDCVNLLNSMCLVIWFLLKSIVDIFVVSWFWKGEQFKCKGSIFRIYCSLILFEIIFDRSLIEFKWKDKFFNEEFVEIFGFQRWLIPYFNIKRLRNYKFRKLTQNGSNKNSNPFSPN